MGLFYGNKLDLANFFWKLRLVAEYSVEGLRSLGKKRDEKRIYLEMDKLPMGDMYPRPQFRRDGYLLLDGVWELSHSDSQEPPEVYEDSINVPFPPQSVRSGVKRPVGDHFWYQRVFRLGELSELPVIRLHFGAADQVAWVYLNGQYVGKHEGGYLPFSFDVENEVNREGDNVLQIRIEDVLDPKYPYGKQSKTPSGMWYTQISGLWQSVWLEGMEKEHIDSVSCTFDERRGGVRLSLKGTAPAYEITLYAPDKSGEEDPSLRLLGKYSVTRGDNFIPIRDIRLWSPKEPWLYYFDISSGADKVRSYFGLRTMSIERVKGRKRICLNHKPVFFHGVLDQGYFSDGIYTPVSPAYYEKDVRYMKELGFNTLRKHIKIEPARFYYDCDRLGMAVFQDMVNNGDYQYLRDTILPTVAPFYAGHFKKDTNLNVAEHVKRFFIDHSRQTMEYLYNFPSVLYYTIFNEGWGQFDSDAVAAILRKTDDTRILDNSSGWYKQKESQVESIHCYFHKIPVSRWKKPAVVSEFGGYSLCIKENSCYVKQSYGYGKCDSKEKLTARIVKSYEEEVIPHIRLGLCASIYTQLSDVEEEINGLYTYDRKVCKVDKGRMKKVAAMIEQEARKLLS